VFQLPPARCAVETCRKRYDPSEDLQRFCPRDGCEFWYHNRCLENVRFERSDSEHYKHRLKVMLKGLDEFEDVPEQFFDWLEENMALKKAWKGTHFPPYDVGDFSNIVWCAQMPISRGCNYGVVGNEALVKEARRLVKEVWEYRDSDLWPTDEEVKLFLGVKKEPTHRMFGCMRCSMAI
jgi:hypothetical protein